MSGPAWPALAPEIMAENNGPRMLIIGWVLTANATLFVAGRIFSRLKKLGKIDTGDYLVLASLALGYIYMSIQTVAVHAGLGRHLAVLTIPQAERALLFTMVGFIPGILSFTIPKFAAVILIKSLLNPSRGHVTAMWALAGVSAALMAMSITFLFAQCDPPHAQWTIGIKAQCWDPIVLIATSTAGGASSALFDFWLALYPATVLWGTQINPRKKVALSTALGFGVCAGSVALYKCTTLKAAGEFDDYTYAAVNLVIWTSIEANCVIISACIPMLMPLVELIFGENFLNGGEEPHLRTIQTYPQVEDISTDSEMRTKVGAKNREDWKRQFRDVSAVPEERASGSKRSGGPDECPAMERLPEA